MNISADHIKVVRAVEKICVTCVAYVVFISVKNILGSLQRFQTQSLCFALDIVFCFRRLKELEQTDYMLNTY
jgi:hypothetical protein